MPNRRRFLPPAAPLAVSLGLLAAAAPPAPALAGDLDANAAVFLRFSLSPTGDGFEKPVLGMRLGPDGGGGHSGNRIHLRPEGDSPLDTALALEMKGDGRGRIALAGFSWNWRLSDLIPEGWLSSDIAAPALAARELPAK